MKRAHHDLKAWQEAMSLVKMVYENSSSFPESENYGLKSQIRRAAVSIPSNIAEGAARTGSKEFLQFLSISRGSLSELETQLLLARNLGYVKNADPLLVQIDKIFGLLGGLMNSLRKRTNP
ncbi:MAG: four helix bundle protein [Syntrophales bacterium]|nr:four helix bundle protein [Syntrophales bacterium]